MHKAKAVFEVVVVLCSTLLLIAMAGLSPAGSWELAWWWGLWTFFGGLVLGFVREKIGGIIAPAILHGLPQAIAYAVLGL